MEEADDLAKLLVEIVLELFQAHAYNEYKRIYIPPALRALHNSTLSHQFEVIRTFLHAHDYTSLRYYDMASLVSLLPLSTVYNVKPVLGSKIGLFIAKLATMRQENDYNFDYSKPWMDITMLDVYMKFPKVFEISLEWVQVLAEPQGSQGMQTRGTYDACITKVLFNERERMFIMTATNRGKWWLL